MEGHVRLHVATWCVWKQESVADAITGHSWALFPWVHAATWPTYWIELLQPLRVQIVQRGKLSHGTHDAHFSSAPSLLHPASYPPPPPTLSPPSRPHPPLGRRTISAPLQAEVEQQQHRCGGSMWSALQLYREKYTTHELCVGAAEILFNLYNKKGTLLSCAALPKEGSVCF